VHGESEFGLHPQPFGTAVLEISTPPQMFPAPSKAGKKSFCITHSVLSLSFPAALQLFTPLNSQQSIPTESQKPQVQSIHIRVGDNWQNVLSGQASQGFSGAVQVQSVFIILP